MPSFHSRISKHLLSTISNPLVQSYESPLRRFSSTADRGRGRGMEQPPEPIPNRPLRGPRPSNAKTTPPHFNHQSPQLQDSSFLEKLKMGLDKSKREKAQVEEEEEPQQPEEANEIFRKMKETGLIPNAVAMLDGLCKDGLVQEAMKLFGAMREKGTIPEVVIYTAVVDGFCKARKPEDAKRIFRKMQTNGIVPNAFSYTVLVQGLYRCDQIGDAVDFCGEMLEAGHSPNLATFVGLLDCVCKESGVEEAQSVIAKLKQNGFLVNDKGVREFLDKRGSFSPVVWEAIFGKDYSNKLF